MLYEQYCKIYFRDSIQNRAHLLFKTDFCTLFMLFGGSYMVTILVTCHFSHHCYDTYILKGMNRRFPYGFYEDYSIILIAVPFLNYNTI